MLIHDRHTAAATRTLKPSSLCQLDPTPCVMTSARSLLLLAFALLATLQSATAATDVLQGDIYLMNSVHQIDNYTDLKAGQSYVANFQVNAQASNATIGSVLGFCTVLRDVGPSQCQYTIQLASGSVQVLLSRWSPQFLPLQLLRVCTSCALVFSVQNACEHDTSFVLSGSLCQGE